MILCTVYRHIFYPILHLYGHTYTYTMYKRSLYHRGSVTYGVAKVIAKVLKPLVGKLPHHIQSTIDFVSKVREVTLLPGECHSSYDVTALFTSVSINPALFVIRDLLEKDNTLSNRTVLSMQNIIELLGFCLHNTYFSFQNKFYEQVEGVAMGSPVSPAVVNLSMECFETEALRSASHPLVYHCVYHIVVPYMKGLGETCKNICRRYGV